MIILAEAQTPLTLEVFLPLMVTIITMIIGSYLLISNKITSMANRVSIAEEKNRNDEKNIDLISSELENLKKDRVRDIISFTEMLGKFNTTLSKFEVTLENNNNIMADFKSNMEQQWNEINGLKYGPNKQT